MKKVIPFLLLQCLVFSAFSQSSTADWIVTTETKTWETERPLALKKASGIADAEIQLNKQLQTIDGFGTCFNELGWTSLNLLKATDRESIFKELFAPGLGANFTLCRMPVGANDFSRNWYSYNETDGDFEMKNFSISNDLKALIPFIKNAMKYNPSLKLWASPWSPPTWMKNNKHYASKAFPKHLPHEMKDQLKNKYGMDFDEFDNGLQPQQEGFEGTNMFIQEDKYYRAYALYFSKFIQQYRARHINISMVMPQNEFNSAQVFPSCTWTAAGLAKFIGYLGPQMQALKVNVFFGTMERANEKLVDTILKDPLSSKFIKGVGFQWAGKDAIPGIHQQYPHLKLYQSEQECGNGKNDWKYCQYTWSLMKHYLGNGASAYMYWNTSLKEGGISTWGWRQNSLVIVDTTNKTYRYNYEYYLMKHLSHFVKPGAKRLETTGAFTNLLAFINTDKTIVIVAQNSSDGEKAVKIKIGDQEISPRMKGDSFNTWVIKK